MADIIKNVLNLLKQAQIEYSPLTYYYTPITLYPRSITPKCNRFAGSKDLRDFQVMIYIHTPFCSRRCTFCPFFLNIGQGVPEEFVLAIKKQIIKTLKTYKLPNRFNIYFGGGSPNLLSINQLREIINCFNKKRIKEISLEVHPEVYKSRQYFNEISKLGINRVSVGLQSCERKILEKSARGHDAVILKKIISEIKKRNLLVNVDLMFGGLYEETLNSAKRTFEYVFGELKPDQVSAYQICIKGGTPERTRYLNNFKKYPDIKTIFEMRALRHKIAKNYGYKYLFGDFFSKGQKSSEYQMKRWNKKPAVIGIGPGTHSYIVNPRDRFGLIWYAPFDIEKYLEMIKKESSPIERLMKLDQEQIDSWEMISQFKTVGILKISGRNELLEKMFKIGLLHKKGNRYRLTEMGILIEDLIYAVLMPIKMWKKLSHKGKKKDYFKKDAKYDWFFGPDTVIKFRTYLKSL